MGIKVFDANNDGRMDILVTDMHSDMSEEAGPDKDGMKSDMQWPESFRGDGVTSIWGNSLFIKEGPGKFREASDAMNLESYCPWGPSVGDLNADGFDDVFIASGMNYPFRYMVNSVKLNDGGRKFVDAEFALGIEPRRGGVSTPWFELDASGADKGHRDAEGLTGKVAIWGARGTRSAAILDIDGDGDLDIVTNDFGSAPMVLVSNLSEKTALHYVEIKLTGTASNRDGLGAIVKVTAGGHDLHEGVRRQLRLPLAQRVSALLRTWRGDSDRQNRGDVADREDADRGAAVRAELADRGQGAVANDQGWRVLGAAAGRFTGR